MESLESCDDSKFSKLTSGIKSSESKQSISEPLSLKTWVEPRDHLVLYAKLSYRSNYRHQNQVATAKGALKRPA
jgi:hypothetical protein